MKNIAKWLVVASLAGASLMVAQPSAKADDCLEIGWLDNAGKWTWYPAVVDDYNDHGRVHIKYEYHHGELELKVAEHEKADGADVIVFRGRWAEGHEHGGKVFMAMEKGHHHAKGWYTNGDDESKKFDLTLRDCKR